MVEPFPNSPPILDHLKMIRHTNLNYDEVARCWTCDLNIHTYYKYRKRGQKLAPTPVQILDLIMYDSDDDDDDDQLVFTSSIQVRGRTPIPRPKRWRVPQSKQEAKAKPSKIYNAKKGGIENQLVPGFTDKIDITKHAMDYMEEFE